MSVAGIAVVASWMLFTGDPVPTGEVTREATMFPDGLHHDFGKVRRGKQIRHVFRVVNTSDVPLHIVSLRCG